MSVLRAAVSVFESQEWEEREWCWEKEGEGERGRTPRMSDLLGGPVAKGSLKVDFTETLCCLQVLLRLPDSGLPVIEQLTSRLTWVMLAPGGRGYSSEPKPSGLGKYGLSWPIS